jgi:hypothetical protein
MNSIFKKSRDFPRIGVHEFHLRTLNLTEGKSGALGQVLQNVVKKVVPIAPLNNKILSLHDLQACQTGLKYLRTPGILK